ncbi:probable staphylococcal-like nuclease CAN1 isoform X2 [Helianthus annuus]|uniref:probable staphylococcal-like nuclease CAN1 isoform X2 n=1 Tax=Helianthus annuus TaxID=4232 RepID=UPI000B8FED56|nr:probable staphylococcal-like nuclease CAN1 isoform X2 [Helianthus annuus]
MESFTPIRDETAHLDTDIRRFKKEHKVPEGLASYVDSSEEYQACWYEELSSMWPEKQPSPEEAAKLVFEALEKVHHGYVFVSDLEGFLRYYGLSAYDPAPPRPSFVYGLVPPPLLCGEASSVEEDETMESSCDKANSLLKTLPPWTFAEHGPRFTMETLPVDEAHVFQEEATDLTVFVAVKEFGLLPSKMLRIISQYKAALASRDEDQAQKLLDKLNEGEYHDDGQWCETSDQKVPNQAKDYCQDERVYMTKRPS